MPLALPPSLPAAASSSASSSSSRSASAGGRPSSSSAAAPAGSAPDAQDTGAVSTFFASLSRTLLFVVGMMLKRPSRSVPALRRHSPPPSTRRASWLTRFVALPGLPCPSSLPSGIPSDCFDPLAVRSLACTSPAQASRADQLPSSRAACLPAVPPTTPVPARPPLSLLHRLPPRPRQARQPLSYSARPLPPRAVLRACPALLASRCARS